MPVQLNALRLDELLGIDKGDKMGSVAETIVKMGALYEILTAAQVLEKHGLLQKGEKATDVVKRYVEANPDINAAIARNA